MSGGAREDLLATGAAVLEDGATGALRVTPPSAASLARAVAVVRAYRLPLRVRGDGDAPAASAPGVLLDLSSLDRIASVDAETGVARAEAGCSVASLETAARRAGCTLGPLLPSVRAGSVGAWLSGPTRGERTVPESRRETAALSVAAVLPDGRVAESRAAPRSATGPDLDHLTLGGAGRIAIVAAAWIRLFPSAPAVSSMWSCGTLGAAVAAVERLALDRIAPARARVVSHAEGARLGLVWEGAESGPLDRARAAPALRGLGLAEEEDPRATWWVRDAVAGHPIEVDARWSSLRAWSARGELQLVGIHAGGAFAVAALAEGRGAEECASLARGTGARVIAPRYLRDAGPGWDAMGAGGAMRRLLDALGVEEGRS